MDEEAIESAIVETDHVLILQSQEDPEEDHMTQGPDHTAQIEEAEEATQKTEEGDPTLLKDLTQTEVQLQDQEAVLDTEEAEIQRTVEM